MSGRRVWLTVLGVLAVGSIAVAAAWQYAAESDGDAAAVASNGSVDTAPSSRSMFPKVLNH